MEDVCRLRSTSGVGTGSEPFEVVYQRNRTAVYRYLRSRATSDDDAAELTAVTFERALRAHGRFRSEGGGEAAWLLRIARNAAIDEARRRSRGAGPEIDAADRSAVGAGQRDVALEEAVVLRILVEALPERQRDAVRLRFAGGLTAREIGVVMGMSEDAAQKHLERALLALKEAYRGG